MDNADGSGQDFDIKFSGEEKLSIKMVRHFLFKTYLQLRTLIVVYFFIIYMCSFRDFHQDVQPLQQIQFADVTNIKLPVIGNSFGCE